MEIRGYFLPAVPPPANEANEPDDDNDGDDDDDDSSNEEFDPIDFSDDNAFSSETFHVKSKCQKQLKVRFKEYSSGLVHEIHGHLPLVDPWWSAALLVRVRDRHLIGFSAYKLRNDDLVVREKVLMLFLKACGVPEDHKMAFENFLQQSNSSGLTFANLKSQLRKFAASNYEIAKQIRLRLKPGGEVQNALYHPWLYEIMPQLLPKHFRHIIQLDEKILNALECALHVRPWVFGFSSILTREFRIHGCEASFKNFYHCPEVYSQLSDTDKDGLFIYETLKDICHREGHTFVEFPLLKKWKIRRSWKSDILKYSVVDWSKGLAFLEENRIIVQEMLSDHSERLVTKDRHMKSGTRIYLSRYYFAEKQIALNLGKLMFRKNLPKWDVQIDFESEHFERIRTDEDQIRAAKLIASKPVVVLSGKGGCGKTEVVGRVFAYTQKTLAQECLFDQCSVTDEELIENADKYAQGLDNVSSESSSASSIALGKSDCNQTSAAMEVYSKCREEDSQLTLLPTQNYSLRKENESAKFEGNSTGSAVENQIDVGRILLTAPTGKAAILLGRRSGMVGYTLHHVVYSYFAWKRAPQEQEEEAEPWKFASVRVLIVDECSLVSVTIFQRVLRALLYDAQLSKVVLLGDVNQLPSIEPGRFLADVYEALQDAGCSITLRTNHRSESQFIVDNAERILQQRLPFFNPDRHFHQIDFVTDEDNDRDDAVRKLLRGGVLPGPEKSQFVAFRRRDCDAINELCCMHYNQHAMKKRSKRGKQVLDFRPGDKVCCSRNACVTIYTNHHSSESSLQNASSGNRKANTVSTIRLCNGEIFFIKEMHEVQENGKKTCFVVLSDLEREIKVEMRELKNFCKLRHAWARTIHTFQGSETDALVYVVGSNVSFQNWQHVYTAVTRGKLQVLIMTHPRCLRDAIRRKPIRRNTSLKARLQEVIARQPPQETQSLPQEESRSFNVIHSNGTKSSGEASALTSSSCDQGLDCATPVKTCLLQDSDAKSVSGGKRKQSESPTLTDGSPVVKQAKENCLADSLVLPIRRQLSMSND